MPEANIISVTKGGSNFEKLTLRGATLCYFEFATSTEKSISDVWKDCHFRTKDKALFPLSLILPLNCNWKRE